MSAPAIAQSKLEAAVAQAVGDLSPTYGDETVSMGHKLGLYKALAGAGPVSPRELANRTDYPERYVSEWLSAQAAGGYVGYHALSDTYELSPEQALVLVGEVNPAFRSMTGRYYSSSYWHLCLYL
ncbi:hypothetical protein [Litchfieldella rifensis]|uniref:S-adenosylmethionine-dependent methyltransferase Rv2258c-like winged HTH domain-containing protein n=1 Tax=Litchfieldella rifensis TaxID=762643 RepID=A0ABV7LQE6_9GAMM